MEGIGYARNVSMEFFQDSKQYNEWTKQNPQYFIYDITHVSEGIYILYRVINETNSSR